MIELEELGKGRLSGVLSHDPLIRTVDETEKRYKLIHKDPIKRSLMGLMGFHDFMEEELKAENLNMEKLEDILKRIDVVIEKSKNTDCDVIIIVSHSGLLDLMIKVMLEINSDVQISGGFQNGKNCWISRIDSSSDNRFRLITPPNAEHMSLE